MTLTAVLCVDVLRLYIFTMTAAFVSICIAAIGSTVLLCYILNCTLHFLLAAFSLLFLLWFGFYQRFNVPV